jgi:hypothetical protein
MRGELEALATSDIDRMDDSQSTTGFDAPIAIFAFNRPALTRRVHDAVSRLRPRSLFLIADGPRRGRPDEQAICEEVRRILTNVDWHCTVNTHFSPYNMGCGRRMSSGLDWLFQQTDSAIILEDDCLPSPQFFYFCRAMLEQYRHDARVGTIAGTNIAASHASFPASYLFSRYPQAWGWATWRRSWDLYDYDMLKLDRFRETGLLAAALGNRAAEKFWLKQFEAVRSGALDTWDCQLCLTSLCQSWLNVIPSVNLVSNIGFGPDATHTTAPSDKAELPVQTLPWPIEHPEFFVSHADFDRLLERHGFRINPETHTDIDAAVDSKWPEKVEIGCRPSKNLIEFGLHAAELYQGVPLRWTSTLAEWIIPLRSPVHPTQMSIGCFGIAPEAGTDVRIVVNGREATRFRVGAADYEESFRLPDLTQAQVLRIQLFSSGRVPEGDSRELGVAIKSLGLHR